MPKDETPSAAAIGRVVVFAQPEKVSISAADGNPIGECEIPQGAGMVQRVTTEGIEIMLNSGERTRLGFDCAATDEAFAPGVPSLGNSQYAALVDAADADGVSAVQVAGGKQLDHILLRSEQGRPFREPVFIGWLDAERMAIVAFRGDARYAVLVSVTGAVKTLATLPELAEEFAVGGGSFWYVTATPGEGIEFGPSGPSTVHRVSVDGKDVAVATEETKLIEALRVSVDGMIAFATGDALRIGYDPVPVDAGKGIPIGWTDDSRLVAVDVDKNAVFVSADGTAEKTAVKVPGDASTVWSVRLE